MVSMHLAAMVLAVAGSGDAVLLDFRADWCAPCRAMDPKVDQLVAAGFPVRKVNKDQDPDLARKFQITQIPCFVMVVGGREVERHVGGMEVPEMCAMFVRANYQPESSAERSSARSAPSRARTVPASYPRSASQTTGPAGGSSRPTDQLLATCVRLTIEDPQGASYGSGTLIDATQGSALILTCGHIFRDSGGKGKISVDMFGPRGTQRVAGELIGYDLKRDIGLVAIKSPGNIAVAHVAPKGYRLKRGDEVVSIGCSHGHEPTVEASRVTATDKFLGPANVEVAGQPVQGRSGGGLFTPDGLVVGVCNAADPADDEGLYAAVATIQAQLDDAHLADLYEAAGQPSQLADGGRSPQSLAVRAPEDETVPPMPDHMPAGLARAASNDSSGRIDRLSPRERAVLAGLSDGSDGAEVICIVRSTKNPNAKSDVVVLDRASNQFLDLLAAERSDQESKRLTSLNVRKSGQPATIRR